MLPIIAEKFPTTPEELAVALRGGLAARGITAQSLIVEGASLAALDRLGVDLTGAQLTRGLRVSTGGADAGATVKVERFEICGKPLTFEGAPLQVEVEAEQAELRFAGQPADGALVLANATRGSIALSVAREALETLLHQLAKGAAEKQGVEVKKTKLELTSRGPRALSFRCAVTAKLFVMSADLELSGKFDLDEQLNARLSGLELGGDAMITKLAGGFIRPHLDKLEGRVVPLLAFSLEELQLRDVEIATAAGLEIRAKFGRS